jgi:hypothetical protein
MGKNNKPLDPKVANKIMLDAGWKPLEPYKNTQHKWKSRCMACKKISYPMLRHVKYSGSECRYCAGTLVDEQDAIRLMKKYHFSPITKYPGSQKPWESKCLKCGQTTSPRYSHVVQRGHCCKYCAPNSTVTKNHAFAQFRKHGFTPLGTYSNSKIPVLVICKKCKHKILKSYSNLMQGTGCMICAGNLPLDKSIAKKFMFDHGFKTMEEFKTVNSPWKSKCITCNGVSAPSYASVKQGKGCRHCSKLGFKYDRESYLYLIFHKNLSAYKIGIGNIPKKPYWDRVYVHQTQGWRIVKVWHFKNGHLPEKIETETFKFIRESLKIKSFLKKSQMKYAGHSETLDANLISRAKLLKIIEANIAKQSNFKKSIS